MEQQKLVLQYVAYIYKNYGEIVKPCCHWFQGVKNLKHLSLSKLRQISSVTGSMFNRRNCVAAFCRNDGIVTVRAAAFSVRKYISK